jgi:hypothetical protein
MNSCAAVCVYSKLKGIKIRTKGGKFVKRQTDQSISDEIDEVIDYAIGVINSIATVSALHECECSRIDATPEIKCIYNWLVLKIKSWQHPAMIADIKSIIYLFKQVIKHIDLVYTMTISSPEKIQFTGADRETYVLILEEYRQMFKKCSS